MSLKLLCSLHDVIWGHCVEMECLPTRITPFRAFCVAFVGSFTFCLFSAAWIRSNVKSGRQFDSRKPLIFIGGFPGSGTTLMRVLLDSHPDIRCGQETRIIPKLLQNILPRTKLEAARLNDAGVTREVLDSAVAAFLVETISRHGSPANRLCNKDPLLFRHLGYVAELFPKAKFILMVRDGRAVVNSIKKRGVTIAGLDTRNYPGLLRRWSKTVLQMDAQCTQLGPSRCIRVTYEELVSRPAHCMREVLTFLDVKWDEAVLHHERLLRSPGQVPLSRYRTDRFQISPAASLEILYYTHYGELGFS